MLTCALAIDLIPLIVMLAEPCVYLNRHMRRERERLLRRVARVDRRTKNRAWQLQRGAQTGLASTTVQHRQNCPAH